MRWRIYYYSVSGYLIDISFDLNGTKEEAEEYAKQRAAVLEEETPIEAPVTYKIEQDEEEET